MRVTDPKPGESLSDYTDRILGVPGSRMRAVGGSDSYPYWEMLWKSYQEKEKSE